MVRICMTSFFNSRAQIVLNPNDFKPDLGLSQQQILNGIGVWISEGSGWTIVSIDAHHINVINHLRAPLTFN